jgi:hypothetical protein
VVEHDFSDQDYIKMVREPGEGPVRIGLSMSLDEDIYSMLFVACIDPDYLFYYTQIAGTENDFLDEEPATLEIDKNGGAADRVSL